MPSRDPARRHRTTAGPRARPVRGRGRPGAPPGRPRHDLAGRRPRALPGARRLRGLAGADPGAAGGAARRAVAPLGAAGAAGARPRRQPRRRRLGRDPLRAGDDAVPGPRDPEGHRPPPARPPRQRRARATRRARRAHRPLGAWPSVRRTTPTRPSRRLRSAPSRAWPGSSSALVAGLDDTDLGREHLVHADLAGNVLLDAAGAPFVIDLSPAWRSPLWAEAVCVLDAVLWLGAPRDGTGRLAHRRRAPGDAPGSAVPGALRRAVRRRALRRRSTCDLSAPVTWVGRLARLTP